MPYGLKEEVIQQIIEVFSKHPQVTEAILYGSRAIGNYKNGSDIDITLKGNDLHLSILNKICNDLDDLLLPYEFDISILNQISNPDLIDHIKRVGRVIYDKQVMN
jgi:predicted nucleotidyltransferase